MYCLSSYILAVLSGKFGQNIHELAFISSNSNKLLLLNALLCDLFCILFV